MTVVDTLVLGVERIYVFSNREPWLTVRRVLWLLTGGWLLFLLYIAYALALLLSIIFAPFAYQAFRLAILALDGGITLEPFSSYVILSLEVRGGT